MLQIENLTLTHKKDLRPLIQNLTFSVMPKDKIAIIGEEGNGKSTLLKAIYSPSEIDSYIEITGHIFKKGLHISYLPQELPESCLTLTAYEYFCMDNNFFLYPQTDLYLLAAKLHLPTTIFYSEQLLNSFSGGEKVKIQLAALVLKKPDLLLLDEPSNDLDLDTLYWLENFILESSCPVLFISHDETLIQNCANGILHLEQVQRKTIPRSSFSRTTYDEYVELRHLRHQQQNQLATNQRIQFQKKMDRYRAIQQKVEHQQNSISRQDPHTGALLKKKMHTVTAMGKRFQREKEQLTDFLQYEEPIFSKLDSNIVIPNGKEIINFSLDTLKVEDRILSCNIHLQVRGPEKISIIGKNGVGKTTLIRQIADQLLQRKDIHAAYMPQNYMDLLPMDVTPVEYLAQTQDHETVSKVRTYLGSMNYTADEMLHPISDLSGGQKAKLFLLKISVDKNDVLILDEPTRNFSPLSTPVIFQILKDFHGAIISISHDRGYLSTVCDTIYELTPDGLQLITSLNA